MSAGPALEAKPESTETGAAPASAKGAPFFALLLLAAVSAVPYAKAVAGGAVWDDNRLVPAFGVNGANTLAQVLSAPFLDRYYRPLVSLSFYLEHGLWGVNLPRAHTTNIAVHVLATLALFGLLLRATADRRVGLVGALLFAVQPAQVAGVAWIGGRTDSLATLAVAVMGLCLFSSVRSQDSIRRAVWMGGAILAYGVAVFTKEQTLPLLVLVPLAYRITGSTWRGAIARIAPFAVVAALYVALWMRIAPPMTVPGETGIARIQIVGQTALYYASLLIAPTPTALHTLTGASLADYGWFSALAGFVLLATAAWATLLLWKRSPTTAWMLALALLVTVPVLNLVAGPSLRVAPYKVGPAGLGVAALLAMGMVSAIDRLWGRRDWGLARMVAVAGVLVFLGYAGLTSLTASEWTGEESVDRAFVRYDDRCLFARYNLAVALEGQGRAAEAAAEQEHILDQLFGSPAVWGEERSALSKLASDRKIEDQINLNQGMRRPPGQWLSRVYVRLAGLRQAAGHGEQATRLLLIGRSMSSFSGADH